MNHHKQTHPNQQPGKALVDCATLEVKDMREFDQAVMGKGGRFLEAPVSGAHSFRTRAIRRMLVSFLPMFHTLVLIVQEARCPRSRASSSF